MNKPNTPATLRTWLPSKGNVLLSLVTAAAILGVNRAESLSLRSAQASTTTIHYQGRLLNASGVPITGQQPGMTFRLYSVPSGPDAPLWTEVRAAVPVNDGLFGVSLGSSTPLPVALFRDNPTLYLGIAVSGDPEMIPREPLASAPYAMNASSVANGSISTASIADGAVTGAKIAASSITGPLIAPGSVGTSQLAAGAVVSDRISAGAVANNHLAAGAVDGSKIAAGAVDGTKLAANSVGTSQLATGAVTNAKIGAGAVDAAKLAGDSVDSSKIVNGSIGAVDVGADAVGTSQLVNGAVTNAKLGTGAVDGSKLAGDAVTTDKIFNGTIGSADLAGGAVDSSKIADFSIGASDLANDSVDSNKIQANAVGTSEIVDQSVAGADIANGAINGSKLTSGASFGASSKQLLNYVVVHPRQQLAILSNVSNGGPTTLHLSGIIPSSAKVIHIMVGNSYGQTGNLNVTTPGQFDLRFDHGDNNDIDNFGSFIAAIHGSDVRGFAASGFVPLYSSQQVRYMANLPAGTTITTYVRLLGYFEPAGTGP